MRIHCLQHLKNETLGNIGTWITQKKYRLTKTLLNGENCFKEPLFPDKEKFDLLLIMGGTMSVYQEREYPWLKPEKKFVKKVIESGKPILGSCFGGQIIAEVLGGKVTKNRYKEIGWHNVRATSGKFPAESRKKLTAKIPFGKEINSGLPADLSLEFTAFMWHGDTFEIPTGAARLFESEACQNQGFLYKDNVLGLQFHPEADRTWVKQLISDSGHELIPDKYIQSEDEICRHDSPFEESRKLAFSLMDWFERNWTDKIQK